MTTRDTGPASTIRSVAHDLRSDLSALVTCAHLVDPAGTGDLHAIAERMLGRVERLAVVVATLETPGPGTP